MNWIQGILAVLLIVGAILGWVILHRRVRGDDTPLIGATKRRARDMETENELEAFVAAYRGGKIDPVALRGSDDTSLELAAITATGASSSLAAPTQPEVAVVSPVNAAAATKTLLRPEVKLAYLTFRSGLRDHHVFVNVRLGDLGFGTAVGKVDLLVCDPGFNYLAAVDVCVTDPPEDIAKATFLRHAGLRHLTLRTREMPKPGQLRALIYGEAET